MKNAMTVLFIIAMVIGSTQTFRHVYVKWIEPTGSVLAEFQTQVEEEMSAALTMDELLDLYRRAVEQAKKAGLPELGRPPYSELTPEQREINSQLNILREEIRSREFADLELFELKFYWSLGLVSFLIGVLVLARFNPWLGFGGIVIGFSEMLCWTSPLFKGGLFSPQVANLLNYKLAFSLVTWVVLIVFWLLYDSNALKIRPR